MAQQKETACPTLSLLHIAGKRWTVPVIETLYSAKQSMQFNAIRDDIKGVTPKNLSSSLKELIVAGLVEKDGLHYEGLTGYESRVATSEYRLTKKGAEFQRFMGQGKELGVEWYGLKGCPTRKCSQCSLF